jgi:hypothetical protein
MSKTLAIDFGCVLRAASSLSAPGFFPAALPAQHLLAQSANLFAPSREVGRELDAARMLPDKMFYISKHLKANVGASLDPNQQSTHGHQGPGLPLFLFGEGVTNYGGR